MVARKSETTETEKSGSESGGIISGTVDCRGQDLGLAVSRLWRPDRFGVLGCTPRKKKKYAEQSKRQNWLGSLMGAWRADTGIVDSFLVARLHMIDALTSMTSKRVTV